jgi:hypothetical protein
MHVALRVMTPDIVIGILSYLNLSDILAFASTHEAGRVHSALVLRLRFKSVINRFAPLDIERLCEFMDTCGAVITGSGAVWVAMAEPNWVPEDLNIVIPRHRAEVMVIFFEEIGYELFKQPIGDAFEATVDNFYELTFPGRPRITISVSKTDTVVEPILAVRNSLTMIAASPDGIVVFYPQLLGRMAGIMTSRRKPDVLKWRERNIGLYVGCVPWTGNCRMSCPRMWRRTAGFQGTAHFNWSAGNVVGQKSAMAVQVLTTCVKFRIGSHCYNPFCEYFKL